MDSWVTVLSSAKAATHPMSLKRQARQHARTDGSQGIQGALYVVRLGGGHARSHSI
jgi:hypothetical protein